MRTVVFLCLILLITLGFNQFLGFADAEESEHIMDEFYEQKENSVDVIYFGTSASQRAYVVPKAYHDDGIAAYTMACGTQPFVLTKYLMKEALKTQKPKLFIVELRGTCQDKDSLWDVAVRRMVDNMKMSQNKIDTIQAVIDYAEGGERKAARTRSIQAVCHITSRCSSTTADGILASSLRSGATSITTKAIRWTMASASRLPR